MVCSRGVAIFASLLLSLLFPAAASDKPTGLWQYYKQNVKETWSNPDSLEVYIPVLSWHNRFVYDDEKVKRYNEKPWGLGGSFSHFDNDGNWNALYLMAFKDSWNRWQLISGYGWEKTWHPLSNEKFRLGAGFTAGVTARDRKEWKYLPIPVILPLISIAYDPISFQMTYVPGPSNSFNVLFGWFRWAF